MKKMVVITGCDSGIGKDLAEIFIKSGYCVCISYLENNPFKDESNVFAYKLDLRIKEETDNIYQLLN